MRPEKKPQVPTLVQFNVLSIANVSPEDYPWSKFQELVVCMGLCMENLEIDLKQALNFCVNSGWMVVRGVNVDNARQLCAYVTPEGKKAFAVGMKLFPTKIKDSSELQRLTRDYEIACKVSSAYSEPSPVTFARVKLLMYVKALENMVPVVHPLPDPGEILNHVVQFETFSPPQYIGGYDMLPFTHEQYSAYTRELYEHLKSKARDCSVGDVKILVMRFQCKQRDYILRHLEMGEEVSQLFTAYRHFVDFPYERERQ